jgi:hypothetical protein
MVCVVSLVPRRDLDLASRVHLFAFAREYSSHAESDAGRLLDTLTLSGIVESAHSDTWSGENTGASAAHLKLFRDNVITFAALSLYFPIAACPLKVNDRVTVQVQITGNAPALDDFSVDR